MFTGIVHDIGEIVDIREEDWGRRLRVATRFPVESLVLGASMACGGPCFTITGIGTQGDRAWFDVDVTSESLDRTTARAWVAGTRINLEPSLRAGDELGGHFVSGHIDDAAAIIHRRNEGDTAEFVIETTPHLSRFIAEKGSVCLDGTSLTVNGVSGNRFNVMIIPHTLSVTTWGERQPGDTVNMEIDVVARYLDRLRGTI